MSSETYAKGLDADGDEWRLDLETVEDEASILFLYTPTPMPLTGQAALELARWLQAGAQGLGCVVCTKCGPCDECSEEHREDYHRFAKGYDDHELIPVSRRTQPADLAEVKKTIGPAGLAAFGALARGLKSAISPDEWTKTLRGWVTPQANRAMETGMGKAAIKHRAVAFSPDEIGELAEAFKKNPTPFGLGELLYAVLDVSGTVQGDTLA